MNKLDTILQTLGIDITNGLYYTKSVDWKADLHLSSRVKRCLRKIKPDAFFCFDNKPLILFFEDSKIEHLHKKIWNINEVPIIIIIDNSSVEIFNGFNFLANKNTLEKLGGEDKLTNFSYFQLVMGKSWEIYEKELSYKNRVDYKLLGNIGAAREQILKQFLQARDNDRETQKRYVKIANALLGKIIFVRYLIDREVKIFFDNKSKKWTNEDFCSILKQPNRAKQFFNTLADREVGFNGDLFRLEDDEYKEIPEEAYSILIKLLESQEISTGQQSLFNLYDFSIIPIEFISNVYEYFIGSKNQAKQGAYYTPLFLVDYILSETIEKFISDNQTYNCKVLDPACGSGVFLVETLRKMIEKYKEDAPEDREQFKNGIKNIAQNNIFGIDKDESAVQVSIFSIYITLLDYMNPPEIANFKFPTLKDINFFCTDFFDKEAKFNTIFRKVQFDYIVGNPPWFRGKNETEKPAYVKYIDERRKKEKPQDIPINIGNKEIAQAFLLRSGDFSTKNTISALIVTSKVLYNLQSEGFRRYFLHNYLIERVFELAPVWREVFDSLNDKAVAPACVLFFRLARGNNTDTNIIEHIALKPSRFFSMFKIFSIYRHDIQTVQQRKLKDYDRLWKVLVYGSYLDFNFVNRLNDEFKTIQNIIEQEKIIFKQGLKRKDGQKQIKVSELKGMSFLDTQKNEMQPFMIINSNQKWKNENVGYIYKDGNGKPFIDLFKPYSLLIAGGILKDLTSNAAINTQEKVFTSSIRALKANNDNQLSILYAINSILCSSLFSYYMLNLGASAGIEREESEDAEIERMWYVKVSDVIAKAKKIEEYQENKYILRNQSTKEISIRQQCDDIVLPSLNLTEKEKELLSYANDITIPLQMKHSYNLVCMPYLSNKFLPNFFKI